MKNILVIILLLTSLISFSQSGGLRSSKLQLNNTGSTIQLMYKNENGVILPFPNGADGQHLRTISGIPTWQDFHIRNSAYQTLTGTSISFNVENGCNLNLTISGNTTVTFQNLTAGDFGVIHITNPASLYTLTFQGYDVLIGQAIRKTNRQVFLSALNKYDLFTWDYNGLYITITGQLDLKLN